MGPLAQASNAALMTDQVNDAVAKKAEVIRGGKPRIIGQATYFEPTLLTNVTHDMDVMTIENFGPILPIMKVKNDDEALSLINDSSYGLTSIIFTMSQARAQQFCDGANTGTVFMNRCDYLDPALPWTGVNQSGIGSSLSKYGLLGVTRRKSKHFRLS